jgi:hypothetical protein
MTTVLIRVDESDRHVLDPQFRDALRYVSGLVAIEGLDCRTVGAQFFGNREALAAADQRMRLYLVRMVKVPAALSTYLQDIPEPLRCHQGWLGILPFNQRVGRDRCAVNHHADLPWIDPRSFQRTHDAD